MKKYLNAFIMLFLLNEGMATLAMQKKKAKSEQVGQELNSLELESNDILSNEIWVLILRFVYFDSNRIKEFQDIDKAIIHLRAKLPLISKNLRLTCKNFNSINQVFYVSKAELKLFYQNILENRFLKFKDSGFYPINEKWGLDEETDLEIAQFILTKSEIANYPILLKLVEASTCNEKIIIFKKLINLILFYGANINTQDSRGYTALHRAVSCHSSNNNLKDIIVTLLVRGIGINIQDKCGNTALHIATFCHSDNNECKNIVKILLIFGANAHIANNKQETYVVIVK